MKKFLKNYWFILCMLIGIVAGYAWFMNRRAPGDQAPPGDSTADEPADGARG